MFDEPIKWADADIIIKRDRRVWGALYQFTDGEIPLEFDPGNGMEILKQVYDAHGNDGFTELEYLENSLVVYKGKLNYNNYKKAAGRISITSETSGIHEVINTRLDTKVDLFDAKNINGGDKSATNIPINVELHSQALLNSTAFDGGYKSGDNSSTTDYIHDFYFTFEFTEADPNALPGFHERDLVVSEGNAMVNNDLPIIEMEGDGEVEFKIFLDFMLHATMLPKIFGSQPAFGDYNVKVELKIKKYYGYEYSRILLNATRNSSTNRTGEQTFTIDTKLVENLEAGDKVYLFGHFSLNGSGDWTGLDSVITQNKNKSLFTSLTTSQLPSNCKGFLVYEVLENIVESITGQSGMFYSECFGRTDRGYSQDGIYSKYFITNGYLIRQFIKNGSPVRSLPVSLKTMLDSLRSIFCYLS